MNHINGTVDVTPSANDDFAEFQGTICGERHGMIQVRDQDGNVFEVEPDQLSAVE